jgi:hypothetical protein
MLEILWEALNEWRKKMAGLKGKFQLPIYDVTIVDVAILDLPIIVDSRDGAEKECCTRKARKHEKFAGNRADQYRVSANGEQKFIGIICGPAPGPAPK